MLPVSPAGRRYGATRSQAVSTAPSYMLAELPRQWSIDGHFPFVHAHDYSHVSNRNSLLEKADLSPWLGPVKDQGDLGCCTGFAYSGLREFINRRYEGGNEIYSPMFVYWLERQKEGHIGQDAGANMATGAEVINQYGICLESEDPYNPRNYQIAPTSAQLDEAKRRAGLIYHQVEMVGDLRSCLRSGYVATIGMYVFMSFESKAVAATGMVPLPQPSERVLGGHAVLVYGYDDARQLFYVRNSWGADWGDKGNFYLPYRFVRLYTYDRFMMHGGKVWQPK